MCKWYLTSKNLKLPLSVNYLFSLLINKRTIAPKEPNGKLFWSLPEGTSDPVVMWEKILWLNEIQSLLDKIPRNTVYLVKI